MPTISHWPTRRDGKNMPANVHEPAERPKFKARGFRLMDEDARRPGPVRWLVKDGKPVPPEQQLQRKPLS